MKECLKHSYRVVLWNMGRLIRKDTRRSAAEILCQIKQQLLSCQFDEAFRIYDDNRNQFADSVDPDIHWDYLTLYFHMRDMQNTYFYYFDKSRYRTPRYHSICGMH